MCLVKVLRCDPREIQQGDYENRTVTVESVVAVTDLVSDHFGFKMQVAANGAACMSCWPWIETPVTVSAGDVLNLPVLSANITTEEPIEPPKT